MKLKQKWNMRFLLGYNLKTIFGGGSDFWLGDKNLVGESTGGGDFSR